MTCTDQLDAFGTFIPDGTCGGGIPNDALINAPVENLSVALANGEVFAESAPFSPAIPREVLGPYMLYSTCPEGTELVELPDGTSACFYEGHRYLGCWQKEYSPSPARSFNESMTYCMDEYGSGPYKFAALTGGGVYDCFDDLDSQMLGTAASGTECTLLCEDDVDGSKICAPNVAQMVYSTDPDENVLPPSEIKVTCPPGHDVGVVENDQQACFFNGYRYHGCFQRYADKIKPELGKAIAECSEKDLAVVELFGGTPSCLTKDESTNGLPSPDELCYPICTEAIDTGTLDIARSLDCGRQVAYARYSTTKEFDHLCELGASMCPAGTTLFTHDDQSVCWDTVHREYVGCFTKDELEVASNSSIHFMAIFQPGSDTLDACLDACRDEYSFGAMKNGNECYCFTTGNEAVFASPPPHCLCTSPCGDGKDDTICGATDRYSVFRTVPTNFPPVAVAKAEKTVECNEERTYVNLDASSSKDPDGSDSGLSYTWYRNGSWTKDTSDSVTSTSFSVSTYLMSVNVCDSTPCGVAEQIQRHVVWRRSVPNPTMYSFKFKIRRYVGRASVIVSGHVRLPLTHMTLLGLCLLMRRRLPASNHYVSP